MISNSVRILHLQIDIVTSLASLRLEARVGISRSMSMSSTLDVWRYRLQIHLVALLCTFSRVSTKSAVNGSQTGLEYSKMGRTMAWYAILFTFGLLMRRFRLRKPRVLLALLHMLEIWRFHFKSFDIVTPRYFTLVSSARV